MLWVKHLLMERLKGHPLPEWPGLAGATFGLEGSTVLEGSKGRPKRPRPSHPPTQPRTPKRRVPDFGLAQPRESGIWEVKFSCSFKYMKTIFNQVLSM